MHNNPVVVIATVKKICSKSEEVEKETLCVKGTLTLDINQRFKGSISDILDVATHYKSSCDRGEFHPTKSEVENGKLKKVQNYIIGQKYLFVIRRFKSDNVYFVRAGEKLGKNAAYYIKGYTEHNTANKLLKRTL